MPIGGGDVELSRYGQEPSETVYGLEPDRDASIELLLRRTVAARRRCASVGHK
jgi:gamma-glutamyl-gamma-aminobutyrate hydrolase PuuD